ncbi:hypothetical protein JTB14_037991 [Gonioctena quinquepunctata]|nr:hypothetical protein JTB14_037991 [Gonioctena quinquepunctata]
MPRQFTYADIIIIHGYCNGNARATLRENQRRFPRRRVTNHQTFNVFTHLREMGKFPSGTAERGERLTEDQKEDISGIGNQID